MPTVVVKLGSSVVAEASGDLRPGVLDRICDDVAALHAPASTWSSSPRARSRAACGCSSCPIRPRAIEDLQAASAVGQGKLYRVYDELLRDRGLTSAQVLLTFFDMSARTHYVNARRTLRKLLDWRIVPVINENDTTTTDEISSATTTSSPPRSRCWWAPTCSCSSPTPAASTPPTRASTPARRSSTGRRPRGARRARDRAATSPLGSGGMRSKVVAADMATAAGIAP